jgi:hypothetical protein
VEEINKKIAAARRRLVINQFLKIATWALFLGLIVMTIGIAAPKIWHIPALTTLEASNFWNAGWIIGGAVLTILIAGGITIANRKSLTDVAVEVDKRFKLKSRISSTVAMTTEDRKSAAGIALTKDAVHQAEVIDVGEQFKIEPRWSMALPLLPMVLLVVLLALPNATLEAPAPDTTEITKVSETSQVKSAVEKLKKKVREKQLTKGLENIDLDFDKIQKSLENPQNKKNEASRKQALVKLNNIKKQITQEQNKLGSSKDFKEALNKLKDVGQGPAKKLADAMQEGDLKGAQKAIKDLAKKLRDGNMTKNQKERLAKDLKEMAKQLKDMADKQAQKQQELKKQIEKAVQKGDLDKAARLQQKLEQMEKQQAQQQKMKDLAKQLQKCAQCMKPGQGNQNQNGQQQNGQPKPGGDQDAEAQMQDAGDQLEDLAKQIQQMQKEMDQLEDLEDLQDAIQECKNGMCPGGKPGDKPGNGMGAGRGFGDRPQEEEKTGNYKSRVRGKLQKGQMVITGKADGENLTGRTTSEARAIVESAIAGKSEPLENQVLPKSQRDHAKQYFESLREGN